MNNFQCRCCGNSDSNNFEIIEYSNKCSMHYPAVLDETKIIYCKKCFFGFNNTIIDQNILDLYYSKYYNGKGIKTFYNVDKKYISEGLIDSRSLSQINLIANYINFENKNILDIGSGICLFFLQINNIYKSKNIYKYIIEKQLDNKNWYKKHQIQIINNNILEDLPSKYKDFFNLITMSHSLEHFQSLDLDMIFKNINYLLKSDGKLFIEVPNADLNKFKYANENYANENMEPHLCFFSKQSLIYLAKKYNFKILYINTFGESQKSKRTAVVENKRNKNSYYTNEDEIKINIEAEKYLKFYIQKQKRNNNFMNKISLFFPNTVFKFLLKINIFFKNRIKIYYDNREFVLNEEDGEYIRIILEKNI